MDTMTADGGSCSFLIGEINYSNNFIQKNGQFEKSLGLALQWHFQKADDEDSILRGCVMLTPVIFGIWIAGKAAAESLVRLESLVIVCDLTIKFDFALDNNSNLVELRICPEQPIEKVLQKLSKIALKDCEIYNNGISRIIVQFSSLEAASKGLVITKTFQIKIKLLILISLLHLIKIKTTTITTTTTIIFINIHHTGATALILFSTRRLVIQSATFVSFLSKKSHWLFAIFPT